MIGAEAHEKNDKYEVFRVNCEDTIINKVRHRFAGSVLGKVFGMIDMAFESWLFYSRLKSLEPCAIRNISINKPVGMVVTAPSFSLFLLAAHISKQTGLRWIADYRDDWTTNEESSIFTRFKYVIFERILEKMALKSASAYFAVSDVQLKKIGGLIRKPGYLLENGYDLNHEVSINAQGLLPFNIEDNKLNVIYTGTLYNTQSLNYLISVLEELNYELRQHLSIFFVGVDERQLLSYPRLIEHYGKTIFSCGRTNKKSADKLLELSDVALYVAYLDKTGCPIKGIPSSKLYEYIKLKKPVIMMPTDGDVAEQTLHSIGLCVRGTTVVESARLLEKLIEEKLSDGNIETSINNEAYLNASCERIVERMSGYMDETFG